MVGGVPREDVGEPGLHADADEREPARLLPLRGLGELLVADVGSLRTSVDRTRRLFEVAGDEVPWDDAFDAAVLATSAQLLGAGERVLDDSVAYVKQRRQFGREIGSYQAIKHALADVRIALDFARPLVFGAALGEVPASAAKVVAGDAAYLAARTGLQVHGAIGYTAEFDLSLWLTKIRALVGAWGTPAVHRARLLESLVRLMEFAFSEEQVELAATVRSLLTKRADSAAVRAAMTSDSGYDADLWRTLVEQIGAAALGIPEEHDGAGFSLFESLIVLQEVGWSLAPSPLLATLVATEALLAGADDDAKARLLPRIAAGEVATVALDGPVLDADRAAIVLAAVDDALVEVSDPAAEVGGVDGPDAPARPARLDRRHHDRRRRRGSGPCRAGRGGRRHRAPGRPGRPRPRHDRRLHQGAGAVRPPDRVVPGAQAPDGGPARAARDVTLGGVGGVARRLGRGPTTPSG